MAKFASAKLIGDASDAISTDVSSNDHKLDDVGVCWKFTNSSSMVKRLFGFVLRFE